MKTCQFKYVLRKECNILENINYPECELTFYLVCLGLEVWFGDIENSGTCVIEIVPLKLDL